MVMDITGANAIYTLVVQGVFNAPVQLQGFAADDVFTSERLESVETSMGVDGKLSGGFVYVPVRQEIRLQADSVSIALFDQWWQAMQQSRSIFVATGLVSLPAIGKKFTLSVGYLKGYTPIPGVKKLLQPQAFGIEWQSVSPSPA
jgi:hypothetical protein